MSAILYVPNAIGCSDGGCILRDNSKGMHTNGGCNCAKEIMRLRCGIDTVQTIQFLRKQLRDLNNA